MSTSYCSDGRADERELEVIREDPEDLQRPEDVKKLEPLEEDGGDAPRRALVVGHTLILAPDADTRPLVKGSRRSPPGPTAKPLSLRRFGLCVN